MLFEDHLDAVKIALVCLTLTGRQEDCRAISCLLAHQDDYVWRLAEHALWSIWFRDGDEQAGAWLRSAVCLVNDHQWEEAELRLQSVVARCPAFAEAWHQQGSLQFLRGRYERAIADLRRCVELNPVHFAAMACLAHSLAADRQYTQALAAYRAALDIHPRFEGLAEGIRELTARAQGHEGRTCRRLIGPFGGHGRFRD
jgi:tetratricopeptide (TPR) repeat protein